MPSLKPLLQTLASHVWSEIKPVEPKPAQRQPDSRSNTAFDPILIPAYRRRQFMPGGSFVAANACLREYVIVADGRQAGHRSAG